MRELCPYANDRTMKQTIITEGKIGRKKVYYVCETDDSGIVVSRSLYDNHVTETKDEDGRTLFLLENSKGRLLARPYHYINDICLGMPITTRRLQAHAINLLYTFCEMFSYDPEHLNRSEVHEFMSFARGINVMPEEDCTASFRTPRTVNGYMGYIRGFLTSENLPLDGYILQKSARQFVEERENGLVKTIRTNTTVNLKTDSRRERLVPKHLKPDQLKALTQVIRESNDTTSLLVMKLQACYGLRSGEALGLTYEDVITENTFGEGETNYILLRNRCSDTPSQFCKGLAHPNNGEDYGQIRTSYWKIPIDEKMRDQLLNYFNDTRDITKHGKDWVRKVNENTSADSIDGQCENHYIFINRSGKCLTNPTWNNHLARYFEMIGVKLDKGVRTSNCSHRLRHSFAMWHAQYSKNPVTPLQLMDLLRHSSLSSTVIYFNMLPEDELKLRNAFSEELMEFIPDLA